MRSDEISILAAKGDISSLKQLANTIGDRESLKKLLNERHRYGWTPLHAAAVNNQTEVVVWLLENGANVNAVDNYSLRSGYDRPSVMIEARHKEFCSHINPKLDCTGWTALHYAAAFGHVEVCKVLLRYNIDIHRANAYGHYAQEYADTTTENGKIIRKLIDEEIKNRLLRQQQLEKEERAKFPLEEQLKQRMIGQIIPINHVAAAIRRRQNGWHDPNKPLVLLFIGSSGVGKTMLAKAIADIIVKDPDGFIRIDMSEYSQKHEVSKFIGAPPGYVGYEEGGQLTSKLAKCPNAVVLLDEVEKAHPDIWTIMLQVFDEGRLTDGRGNTVDCKNAIFIMTSNLVQDEIHSSPYQLRPLDPKGKDLPLAEKETKKFIDTVVQPILKRHFKRDEFLGRIDEIIVFHPFSNDDLKSIVTMEMKKWQERALQRHNITIKWTDDVIQKLTEGYNPYYGFRSIQREVEKKVVNQLADAHEKSLIVSGSTVEITLDANGEIVLKFPKSSKK